MPSRFDRKKSKNISRSEDLVPRSAPHPMVRMPIENVPMGPTVPELSLMINGKPRPAIHLLQMPGESGFMARAPSSNITPRLSARAVEKVSSARVVTEDEGAVGGPTTKEEAEAMLFFKQFSKQFGGETNGVDSNEGTIKLDKFKGSHPKKNRERVRAAIAATTLPPSLSMPPPPPPIPTPHTDQPKVEPSVPELSVLENIPAKNSGAMKKVTFEEFVEQNKDKKKFVELQHQQQNKQKPKKFSKCERTLMENQLEAYERRITELELKLSTTNKQQMTRERGVQAPIVRDKSTQVTPGIFDPPKNSKKSKKRGERNPVENLKIIIPTPIPKPPPKPVEEPIDTHDPSTDVITQEKLLKALAQINCIFSASLQSEPGRMPPNSNDVAGDIIGAASNPNETNSKDATTRFIIHDKGTAERNASAKSPSLQIGDIVRGPRSFGKIVAVKGPTTEKGATAKLPITEKGATAKCSGTGKGATAKWPATTAKGATSKWSTNEKGAPVKWAFTENGTTAKGATTNGTTGNGFALRPVTGIDLSNRNNAAAIRKTITNPVVIPTKERNKLMKQLAAKYLPEWQHILQPDDEKENGNDENNRQPIPGTSNNSQTLTMSSNSPIENLRNYNEFPFDSSDENETNVKKFDNNVNPFAMSSEDESLLTLRQQRNIVMTDDQNNTK